MKTVDARGFACPQPVIMAQKAIKADAPGELQVLVDNKCAVENVTRFGESQGYTVTAADNGDDEFTVTLRKEPYPLYGSPALTAGGPFYFANFRQSPSKLDRSGKI